MLLLICDEEKSLIRLTPDLLVDVREGLLAVVLLPHPLVDAQVEPGSGPVLLIFCICQLVLEQGIQTEEEGSVQLNSLHQHV
jgi:hypothetical protein